MQKVLDERMVTSLTEVKKPKKVSSDFGMATHTLDYVRDLLEALLTANHLAEKLRVSL